MALIREYGLFWDIDGVDWNPGSGSNRWRLVGREGTRRPRLRVADHRDQRGLYILHDHRGIYYVGLARSQGIGDRVKQHLTDHHDGKWHRFSWFGFREVLKSKDRDGYLRLRAMSEARFGSSWSMIGDLEALLIQLHEPRGNGRNETFARATQWEQVSWWDELAPP